MKPQANKENMQPRRTKAEPQKPAFSVLADQDNKNRTPSKRNETSGAVAAAKPLRDLNGALNNKAPRTPLGGNQGWKFMCCSRCQELCQQTSWLLIGCKKE